MTLKLYTYPGAPSPRRAVMALTEKRVDYEAITIDIANGGQFEESYRAINPRCTVPALELEDGTVLTDNASIVRWLEEEYPDPPLLGTTSVEKAMTAEWLWRVDFEGLSAVMEILRNSSKRLKDRAMTGPDPVPQIPELAARGRERATRFLKVMNDRLGESAWLGGDTFSAADIGGFMVYEFAGWVKLDIDPAHEHLHAWYEAIKARPSAGVL